MHEVTYCFALLCDACNAKIWAIAPVIEGYALCPECFERIYSEIDEIDEPDDDDEIDDLVEGDDDEDEDPHAYYPGEMFD